MVGSNIPRGDSRGKAHSLGAKDQGRFPGV